MTDAFTLDTVQLGGLPIINAFCDRLGLSGLLEQFVPHDDVRVKLAPSAALGVVIRNLAIGHRPSAIGPCTHSASGRRATRRPCSA